MKGRGGRRVHGTMGQASRFTQPKNRPIDAVFRGKIGQCIKTDATSESTHRCCATWLNWAMHRTDIINVETRHVHENVLDTIVQHAHGPNVKRNADAIISSSRFFNVWVIWNSCSGCSPAKPSQSTSSANPQGSNLLV